jgi:hypothetical protein
MDSSLRISVKGLWLLAGAISVLQPYIAHEAKSWPASKHFAQECCDRIHCPALGCDQRPLRTAVIARILKSRGGRPSWPELRGGEPVQEQEDPALTVGFGPIETGSESDDSNGPQVE